jgi:alginate O-acetyltransferase complex protein AlgI
MLFNSLPFLYGFLPVTYLVFWRLHGKQARYVWLTATGYVFYSFWDYRFTALMATSTLVSYGAGLGLATWNDLRRRRLCVIIPVTIDLCLLGFFKYASFAADSVNGLAGLFHLPLYLAAPRLVLPVGISFYTFHTISYIIDSYRRTVTPTRNFFEFSCYVSLFSQLVAGLIVRFREIEQDLENIDRHDARASWMVGWSFFTLGMIKKVLIADTLAALINPSLADYTTLSSGAAWLCMVGYAYQIYFDFSGYSDMAVGLGHLFGLRIPQNFNSPYRALDPADFWRRWHISLSTCLRDYLYIPLGGNRGPRWTVYRNLMLTMLLGGLWHGASWTFVAWGGYHGALLMAYRLGGRFWDALPAALRRGGTFALVVVGWVFFRATSWPMAWGLLQRMFGWGGAALPPGVYLLPVVLVVAALLAHVGPNTFQIRHAWRPAWAAGLAVLFALCLVAIYGGPRMPFLYFQF